MVISRRTFCRTAALAPLASGKALPQTRFGTARCVTEWSIRSGKSYRDPFNEIELDVAFTGPDGATHKAPAFWSGGSLWRVRYAPTAAGRYTWKTICSDSGNPDLHNVSGALEVGAYNGQNALYRHGPIRVAADHRHFQHEDGTPFFWLGGTSAIGLY